LAAGILPWCNDQWAPKLAQSQKNNARAKALSEEMRWGKRLYFCLPVKGIKAWATSSPGFFSR